MNCIECHKNVKKAIPVWKGKKGKEIVYVCLDCWGPFRNLGKWQKMGIKPRPKGMVWSREFLPEGMREARYKALRARGFSPSDAARFRDWTPGYYEGRLQMGPSGMGSLQYNPLGVDLLTGLGLGGGWWLGQQAVEKGAKFLGIKKEKDSNPLYEDFHNATPKTREVDLPVPDEGDKLCAIGRLESVTYTPYGSSSLRGRHFEHKSGDTGEKILKNKPILASDSKGKHLYIIPDRSRQKMTERGIIG